MAESPTLQAPLSDQLDHETRAYVVQRLVSESRLAEASHVILAVVAGYLTWGTAPHGIVIGWVAAVSLAAVARAFVRARARRSATPVAALRQMRAAVIVAASAWGGGVLLMGPYVDLTELALLEVLFAGLVAGATVSLLADRASFNYFVLLMLSPFALTMWYHGGTKGHTVGILFVVIFGLIMTVFFQRSHAAFIKEFRVSKQLELTERAAGRERAMLDALISGAPSAIVVTARDGGIIRVNRSFERLFGYGAEEVQGQVLTDLIAPGELNADAEDVWTRVWNGEVVAREVRRQRKDGSVFPARLAAAPVTIDGEQIAFALYDDVTAQAAAREAMDRARIAAEQVAAARSAFLANMSHEIRTPMNGILGMVELLLDTTLDAEQRRSVDLIQESGEALLTIINDILDFSKIEAGELGLEAAEFDVSAVAEATARLLTPKAFERGLELVCDVAPDLPHTVVGDPGRLRQVLNNLIGNAIKFTHKGEVVITVTATPPRDGKSKVRFGVRDSGIGIPADKQAAIFEPFKQADASTSRRYGGTGLGLSISTRLVGMMGGRLELKSKPGIGSEFFFSIALPVATQASPAETHRESLEDVRVLVVDDHRINRRVTREVLTWAHCVVDEADGTDSALEKLRAAVAAGTPFRLLACDVHMPGRDGFEFVELLRRDPDLSEIHVMLLTSAGRRGDGQRCRELGISAYLLKPVSRGDLLEAATSALAKRVDRPSVQVVTRHSIHETRRGLHILLAEDNEVNQEVATAMLKKRGHKVDLVANGALAVMSVRSKTYDVVLMDLQMPEMDGLSATQEIRKFLNGKPLPIIAVTANALSGEREKCIAAGMDDYLAKPFRPHDLFALVENWAGMRGKEPGAVAPAASPDGVPVDVEGFKAEMRDAGVEEAVGELMAVYLRDSLVRMAALEAAVQGGEPDAIDRAAHAFKSAAGAIRAKPLAELLKQLESAARGGNTADAPQQLRAIRGAADAAANHLKGLGYSADAR